MDINSLTIGEARQIAAMFGAGSAPAQTITHGLCIVVLDRGFVYIGKTITDGEWCHISDAQNIRCWGTEHGLGQLANEGPTGKTRLDAVGAVKAPMHALIHIIPVKESAWKSVF